MFSLLGMRMAVVCLLAAVPVLAGCAGPGIAAGRDAAPDRLRIVTGFYAAQYLGERIGGERVEVTSLTAPGAEPHDLELTARQVVGLAKADLVVTLRGFQPAVDEGIIAAQADPVLDLAATLGLVLAPSDHTDAGHEAGHDAASHDEAGGEHAGHEEPADLSHDPHFWLDPGRMTRAAEALAHRLGALDPAGATTYAANLQSLRRDLTGLTDQLQRSLAHCRQPDMVVGHAAFGHLAHIAGLTQHALALTPESDPTPAVLAEITHLVRTEGITTLYTEPLTSPRVAEVVAAETGATTAVLDPIEGITDHSAGIDYLALMRANIETLAAGQECAA